MNNLSHRFLLGAIFYLIAAATGMCGVITHSVTLNPSDLTFTEVEEDSVTFVIPEIAGIESYGRQDCPILPKITLHFALPVYATDINLEVSSCSSPTHHTLSFPIASGVEHILSSFPSAEVLPYAEGNDLAAPIAEIFHIENYKGLYKIVSVVVNPLRKAGDGVDLFDNISFAISFNEINIGENTIYENLEKYEHDLAFLRDMVENPEVIITPQTVTTYSSTSTIPIRPISRNNDAYEYTIVTSEELAPAFQRLVALKRIQGFDAGITTIEYIFGCGKYSKGDTISNICDSAGILKAYFMDNKDVIEYILLGGKPPIVPIRYGHYFHVGLKGPYERHIPSDLYYGTESTNWNIPEHVSKYGEYGSNYDDFDYSSKFKIGRLPCTTQQEVNNYIDKLEIYELNPGLGDRTYLQRGYGHASTQISYWNEDINHEDYNLKITDKMNSNFITSNYSYGKTNFQTGKDVIQEMDENYAFLNLMGHGNPEGISTIDHNFMGHIGTNGINALDKELVWHLDESKNGLDNIHNFGKPNVMLTLSCNTMAFDSPAYKGYGKFDPDYNSLTYNMSESFTLGKNYGGIAYIGYTRPVFHDSGAKMNLTFLSNLAKNDDSATIGNLVELSRANIDYSFHHIDLLGYGLAGDPSVHIWRGTTLPQEASDPHEINRNFNDSTITIVICNNVDQNSLVRKYSRVSAVEPNGRILNASIKENVKQVTFKHIDPKAVVYMTGNNIIPYIGDLRIVEDYNFSQHGNYIYSREVNLGHTETVGVKTTGNVKFSSVSTTIDATGKVVLGNNVIVGDNNSSSTLTIITPDTCYIHSLKINGRSKATIYAGCTVLGDFTGNEESLARIEIKPYDKYGLNDKLKADIIKKQPKSRGHDYRPMLEEGKTWKYSLVDWTTIIYPTHQPGRQTEYLRETKLEGYETINGETYMKLVVYYDGSDTPAESNPLYYLREDTETGRVYFYPHLLFSPEDGVYDYFGDPISWENETIQRWAYEEWCLDNAGLLYDFNATDGRNFSNYETQNESYITLPDGEHRCLLVGRGSMHYGNVIEGIGFTSDSPSIGIKNGSSILGISRSCFPTTPDSYYDSYLYEVVNGDGEVIYTDENYRPGWWMGLEGLKVAMADAKVSVTADGIAITGAPAAEACLYDMQGRVLSRGITEGGSLTIATAGLSAGVYVLRLGSQTYKVAIR